jgi:hypothetical protein
LANATGRSRRHARDVPDEGRQFAGDRNHGNVGMLASRNKSAIPFAEPKLGIPRAVDDRLGKPLIAFLDGRADLGRMTIRPRCFNEQAPCVAVGGSFTTLGTGCLGLTPTPYASGTSEVEQGISKAGNKRCRWLMG